MTSNINYMNLVEGVIVNNMIKVLYLTHFLIARDTCLKNSNYILDDLHLSATPLR